jgi:TPR repeat protein
LTTARRPALSHGNISATRALAALTDVGRGTEMDRCEATLLYIKVGLAGDDEVQRALGSRFENEGYVLSGVDLIEAYAWYNVSAASGNEGAIKGRANLESKLKPAEITLAHRRSRELLKEIEANTAKK